MKNAFQQAAQDTIQAASDIWFARICPAGGPTTKAIREVTWTATMLSATYAAMAAAPELAYFSAVLTLAQLHAMRHEGRATRIALNRHL